VAAVKVTVTVKGGAEGRARALWRFLRDAVSVFDFLYK
jgi:hypothetical protein